MSQNESPVPVRREVLDPHESVAGNRAARMGTHDGGERSSRIGLRRFLEVLVALGQPVAVRMVRAP